MNSIDGYVHPAFSEVAVRFTRLFRRRGSGGGALAVRLRGEPMIDIWAGSIDEGGTRPWTDDTMSMSFSTTKGVASTVIHRLADRGLIDYDERVAEYWPEFAVAGKHTITVRQMMSHQAGLHNMRDLIEDKWDMLDHRLIEARLAAATPDPAPMTGPGYHGFTYGWLASGLARAVTGEDMTDLVKKEIAEPLNTDGINIGIDAGTQARVAPLIFGKWGPVRMLGTQGHRLGWTNRMAEAFYIDGFDEMMADPEQRMLTAQMPAVNGTFTARGLAKMYGAFANGGQVDGVQLLSRSTVHEMGRVVTRDRDYVLGFPMRWRMGYHRAFTGARSPRHAFGHYGFGGSGGWADPGSGLSLGFVTNRLGSATTPLADGRLVRLSGAVVGAAKQLG